jgi:hypothetical protein
MENLWKQQTEGRDNNEFYSVAWKPFDLVGDLLVGTCG